MERKLASIQTVSAIEPIENADAIERATILGWNVVVKKNEFKVNDRVIYCEIDSLFPEKPEFEFLRSKHFRIKTVKFRGQISQGICFPMSILPSDLVYHEGDDVTALMGITKYEAPVPVHLAGMVKGNFPAFLIKTDETRIQSAPGVLTRHEGVRFVATEKLNGTSMTVYFRDGDFGVCSRNMELKEEGETIYWKIANNLNLKNKIRSTGLNLCLQGELIGWGIQGNYYKVPLNAFHFKVFNIFDIDKYSYLSYYKYNDAIKELDLESVPVIDDNFSLTNITINDILNYAQGKSVVNKNVEREGLVFKSFEEMRDYELGRLSFKVISNKFLLKGGD